MQIIFTLDSDPAKVLAVEVAVFVDGRQDGVSESVLPAINGQQATLDLPRFAIDIDSTDVRVREWAPNPTDWRKI
jgi:hypothetical protein